jgi:hypothetical protein
MGAVAWRCRRVTQRLHRLRRKEPTLRLTLSAFRRVFFQVLGHDSELGGEFNECHLRVPAGVLGAANTGWGVVGWSTESNGVVGRIQTTPPSKGECVVRGSAPYGATEHLLYQPLAPTRSGAFSL